MKLDLVKLFYSDRVILYLQMTNSVKFEIWQRCLRIACRMAILNVERVE